MNPEYTFMRLSAPGSDRNATLNWHGIGRIYRPSDGDYRHLKLNFIGDDGPRSPSGRSTTSR
jgi:hypothetical protein